MAFNPAIIALLAGSALVVFITAYSSLFGIQIILGWDLSSGSEQQLRLERKTYLIATIVAYVMGFQLLSLFLFVHTADTMHELFVGAMCAAGTLNVNDSGYPALMIKMISFMLCGVWVIVNHVDNQGYDYPLIRFKYRFLLIITGLLALEALLQAAYFTDLRTDVIASCCGSLFSASSRSLGAGLAHLPLRLSQAVFFLGVALALRTGIGFYLTGRNARAYSWCSLALFAVALVSVISFISIYVYQLPTHHCPFCLLQGGYGYIGYPLYLLLLCAGITGAAVGLIDRFRAIPSIAGVVPRTQKRLCLSSMICYTIFTALSSYPVLFSEFSPYSL